jgi:hypothetical protein
MENEDEQQPARGAVNRHLLNDLVEVLTVRLRTDRVQTSLARLPLLQRRIDRF